MRASQRVRDSAPFTGRHSMDLHSSPLRAVVYISRRRAGACAALRARFAPRRMLHTDNALYLNSGAYHSSRASARIRRRICSRRHIALYLLATSARLSHCCHRTRRRAYMALLTFIRLLPLVLRAWRPVGGHALAHFCSHGVIYAFSAVLRGNITPVALILLARDVRGWARLVGQEKAILSLQRSAPSRFVAVHRVTRRVAAALYATRQRLTRRPGLNGRSITRWFNTIITFCAFSPCRDKSRPQFAALAPRAPLVATFWRQRRRTVLLRDLAMLARARMAVRMAFCAAISLCRHLPLNAAQRTRPSSCISLSLVAGVPGAVRLSPGTPRCLLCVRDAL